MHFQVVVRSLQPTLRLLALTWGLVSASPRFIHAQVLTPKPGCGTDTAFGDFYRAAVERLQRRYLPAVAVHWSPSSPELCASARAAMLRDSTARQAAEVLYVYTFADSSPFRYAVLEYSPHRERVGEWFGRVCLFDEHWQTPGVCLVR